MPSTATSMDPLREEPLIRSWKQMFSFLLSGSGVWAMLGCSAAAILYKTILGHWDWLDGAIIAGFFFFRGIIEWGIHSWLYHANPLPLVGWRLAGPVSEMHYKHHLDPLDMSTFLVTWKGMMAVMAVTLSISSLLLWSVNRGMSMMLGFAIVGLMIELLHLVCHCRIPHRSPLIKRLVLLHRSHHYKHHGKNYGVSSSLGDYLLGTYEPIVASSFSTEELGHKTASLRDEIRAGADMNFGKTSEKP